TVAHLEYLRDRAFPFLLDFLRAKESFLLEYGRRGPEPFRQSKEDLFGIQNSRKARIGGLEGLRDQAFMGRKARAERALRDRIQADPRRQEAYGAACAAAVPRRWPRSWSPARSWPTSPSAARWPRAAPRPSPGAMTR